MPNVVYGAAGWSKMSLVMSIEMKRVIEDLAEQANASQAQVIRQAVALLKTVKDAEARGEFPVLVDSEANIVARLTGV